MNTWISSEYPALSTQERDDCSLDKGGSSLGDKTWLESKYEPTEYDRLHEGWERKENIHDNSMCFCAKQLS